MSDRGAAFTSREFQQYCKSEKIDQALITTGVPWGNGQVESIHGIIIPALTKMSIANPLKLYLHVQALQRFINSTISLSTNRSPFKFMFGVPMRNPEDQKLTATIEEALRDRLEKKRHKDRIEAMSRRPRCD